jgi:hypothetical protein
VERLVAGVSVDWFPHLSPDSQSPDSTRFAFVAYPVTSPAQ